MGLIDGLLTLPLAPVRGVIWVAERLAEQAEMELYDEDRIRAQLVELELAFEEGEIDEEELRVSEEILFERLEVAREMARAQNSADGGE